MPVLPMHELISSGFCFSVLMFGISSLLLLAMYFYRWKSDIISLFVWFSAYAGALLLTRWMLDTPMVYLVITLAINILFIGTFQWLIKKISLFGLFFLISLFTPSFYGLIWFFQLIYTASFLLSLHFNLIICLAATLMSFLVVINTWMWSWIVLNRFSPLYFRFPRRQEGWKKAEQAQITPWVSIHIPCYAEPPDLVIETLDALAKLDYSNFEVIILENNTKDPNLWKPIQEYCVKLGNRFRFVHVDELKGAKAGALNQALKLTSPEAELIAVVDADFKAKPDFLKKLVGFFADPKVGFVQSCQDYRDWRQSRYLSSCYFEYQTHFKLEMPGQNEWDVNYTIGTMCLIRKKALEEAGGWAEWCLTEDSEVAVRIHTLDYTGYFLKESFGYGLIPESFEAYKQQRFRWTAGPSQQFQHHWRLYLPWSNSGLTGVQKMGETFHSLATFFNEAQNFLLTLPILVLCLWFYLVRNQIFIIPPIILLAIPIAIGRNMLCNWIKTKLLGGNWLDGFFSSLASRSLVYTRNLAFMKAWLSKNLIWRRTEKFKIQPNFQRAFSSAKRESFYGLIYLLITLLLVPFASFKNPDIIFLIWLGFLNQALTFFCAPLMALLSEKDLNSK